MEQILKTLELLINQGISIKKGINQVSTISELLNGSTNYDCQRIERWQHRVKIFLEENIDTEVAIEFINEGTEVSSFDWYENICGELKSKNSFLQSIKDDIEQNPEFWKNRLLKNKKNQDNYFLYNLYKKEGL